MDSTFILPERGFESFKTIEDIHNMLLADIQSGFLKTKDKSLLTYWKSSFKKCCKLPSQQDRSIEDDFNYLERTGQLKIGEYDKLVDILTNVDVRAADHVKEALEEIKRRKKSLHSKAHKEKTGKKEEFETEIRIAIRNQDEKIQKEMTELLHQFFKKRESDSDSRAASRGSYTNLNEDENEIASDMSATGSPRREKNGDTNLSKDLLECIMGHSLSLCEALKKCKGIKTSKLHSEDDIVIRVEFEKST